MADLKKDLDEYLLLQSDQKKSFKLHIPTIQKPNVSNWFKKNEPADETTWFQETKSSCCPSLVRWSLRLLRVTFNVCLQSRIQRITGFSVCIFMGILCLSLSTMYIPVLLLKARKFAMLFTLGSVFFILRLVNQQRNKLNWLYYLLGYESSRSNHRVFQLCPFQFLLLVGPSGVFKTYVLQGTIVFNFGVR